MRIISTHFDYPGSIAYEKLLRAFIQSIKENMPNTPVTILHIPVPEQTLDNDHTWTSNTAKMNAWVEQLETTNEDIIFMDCDMLVLKDFSHVFTGSSFDIGYTSRTSKTHPINGGVVFVRNTKNAHDFIKKWHEINTRMYTDKKFHHTYFIKYAGINQSAFGYLLETPSEYKAHLKELPCAKYNACDENWGEVTNDMHVLHIKGKLRKEVLRKKSKYYPHISQIWNGYSQRSKGTPEEEEARAFKRKSGYTLDLNYPGTFLEKLIYKKLYDRNEMMTIAADKLASRKYVTEVLNIDSLIIPILYESYDKHAQIPFEKFQSKNCILKMNKGSGTNIFYKMPRIPNHIEVIRCVQNWWECDYGKDKNEWAYEDVPQALFVEKLLLEQEKLPNVYRLHTMNGVVQCIEIYTYLFDKKPIVKDITVYKRSGLQKIDVQFNIRQIGNSALPNNIMEMIQISEKLAKPFDYIRVDLYNVNGRIFFSELTNYPMSGRALIKPHEFDVWLGSTWKLSGRYIKDSPAFKPQPR